MCAICMTVHIYTYLLQALPVFNVTQSLYYRPSITACMHCMHAMFSSYRLRRLCIVSFLEVVPVSLRRVWTATTDCFTVLLYRESLLH